MALALGLEESVVDRELRAARENTTICELVRRVRTLPYSGVFRAGYQLYTIVRLLQPRVAVETGVGTGYSTCIILEAMRENGHGELHSIDLPNSDANWRLPRDQEPGFLVPHHLRDRWELSLGRSHELLPTVLSKIGPLELFFHDSEHSYDNMLFEYHLAFPRIRRAGILLSDDAMWNTALLDFSREIRHRIDVIYHDGGSAPITSIRKTEQGTTAGKV